MHGLACTDLIRPWPTSDAVLASPLSTPAAAAAAALPTPWLPRDGEAGRLPSAAPSPPFCVDPRPCGGTVPSARGGTDCRAPPVCYHDQPPLLPPPTCALHLCRTCCMATAAPTHTRPPSTISPSAARHRGAVAAPAAPHLRFLLLPTPFLPTCPPPLLPPPTACTCAAAPARRTSQHPRQHSVAPRYGTTCRPWPSPVSRCCQLHQPC